MKRIWILVFTLATLFASAIANADGELHAYFKKGGVIWEKRSETKIEDVTVTNLRLISQTWQGIIWEHDLQIFSPANPLKSNFCTLLNTGGSPDTEDMRMGALIAKSSRMPFAILYQIPKQPLYGGLTEDALIVYTWAKFMETGDPTWPLHFPMAKAVLKAMDAVQEYTKGAKLPEINEFLITGASKRGWTTWLVGASKDKRIKGIAPMVIDTLNVAAQLPHQLEAFGGKPSEQIDDYSNGGMLQALQTERGQQLLALEDPYSYRDILTLPKLLINGTNDRYWAQDALNLYWDGLKGPKWVSYVPNSGHGLEDRVRTFNVLTAFAQSLALRQPFPKMKWDYGQDEKGVVLTLKSTPAPKSARLFRAFSNTKDFRDSKWTSEPMEIKGGTTTGRLDAPAKGFAAVFGEATYDIGGKSYTLSTQIRILGGK